MTAKAARNSRSNTRVSLTLAAVAAQATGTPSPVVAMWYLVPRLPRSVGLGPVRSPPRLARTEQVSRIRVAAQHADQDGMNLRQHTDARPLLQMAAQGRTADLAGGRRQAAPRRAFPQELSQRGHYPNRCRSGMTTTLLLRWRTEIDDCRDQVQISEVHCFPPCLTRQTWSFQINNAPHRCCITAIPSNQSARDPTTHGISGNCL